MLYNFVDIKQFLYKPGQYYEIPAFQRPYSWTKADAELFLQDLENIHSHPDKDHYFGSIICAQYGNRSDIIDGQQRATTVLLMLTALYHLQDEFPERGTTDYPNANTIRKHFLYNDDTDTEANRIKLRTVTVDNTIFEKIFTRAALTPAEQSSRLFNVYQYFYDYFQNKPDSTSYIEDLRHFRVVELTIEHDRDDAPQRIFESINSTGHPLTDGDKIRNYALMLGTPNLRDKIYQDYWRHIEKSLVTSNSDENLTEFFRLYLISVRQREVLKSEGRTYNDFKLYFQEHISNTSDESQVTAFFEQIVAFLDYYLFLKFPTVAAQPQSDLIKDDGFRAKCTAKLHAAVFRLNYLRIETPYPFLMQVLNSYRQDQISEAETLQIFSTVESYLIRRQLCGLGTNSLNKVFYTLHKNILALQKNYPEASYLDAFTRIFLDFRGNTEFPRDPRIAASIRTEQFYKFRDWTKLFILCSINDQNKESQTLYQMLNTGDTKQLQLSIEHVMPQTLSSKWKADLGENWDQIHDQYIHTLPNLTLTGYNSEYSNLPFNTPDKPDHCKKTLVDKNGEKVGLDYSPLHINQYFREVTTWDKAALEDRAQWYSIQIARLWPLPQTDFQLPDQEEVVDLLDGTSLKDRKAVSYSILGIDYSAEKTPWITIYQHIMHTIFATYPELYQKYLEHESLAKYWISSSKDKFKHSVPLDILEDETSSVQAHYFLNSNASNDDKANNIRNLLSLLPDEAVENLNIQFTLLRQQ